MISMLTGLKVSSLVQKCILYKQELTGKWGPHGTEIKFFKFKIEMDQQIELRVHEKNRGIPLVMFTHRFTVVKMSKMTDFMYFLMDTAKNPS